MQFCLIYTAFNFRFMKACRGYEKESLLILLSGALQAFRYFFATFSGIGFSFFASVC